MPDPTLATAGALLDLLAVCHKGRSDEALRRAWTVVTAAGEPRLPTVEAFVFVAERSGYSGPAPWGPADDEPEEDEPDA